MERVRNMSETVLKRELVIIGGGPAGLAAAVAAVENGVAPEDILIFERETELGGILLQCIHNGFGIHRFGEELSGPEYAARFADRVRQLGIPAFLSSMVLSLCKLPNGDKRITAVSSEKGLVTVDARAVVLAMGCRERNRGALNIPGSRPAGIYTAGAAQKFVNIKGFLPGKKVVILGSGDIGLIMARRMTLEGAKVVAVAELLPYSGGLSRNIQQCLRDFDIPLLLSHTITQIHGKERVTGVTISEVDNNRTPIKGTEQFYECDTVLLSCGLIPENELTVQAGIPLDPVTGGAKVSENRETAMEGVFAAGNVLHVHDLVDFVSAEAELAGKSAAKWLCEGERTPKAVLPVCPEGIIRYVVPQSLSLPQDEDVRLFFRVGQVAEKVNIIVECDGIQLYKGAKQKVLPGEMESVTIKADKLQNIPITPNGKITVRLEKR